MILRDPVVGMGSAGQNEPPRAGRLGGLGRVDEIGFGLALPVGMESNQRHQRSGAIRLVRWSDGFSNNHSIEPNFVNTT